MKVLLANPRGFCAGVDRAIEIVERALQLHGAPIYVRHEVVHNKFVVDDLRAKGAVFVEELADVPAGATVVFSAHGVSQGVRREAEERGLHVFDATCPLVTKVHVEVAKMRDQGREIVMIGHRGHPEVEGTMGQSGGGMHLVETPGDVDRLEVSDPGNLAFVTQTTLSMDDARVVMDALKRRFPGIVGPEEGRHLLCHAESPGCGQGARAPERRRDRRRLAEQLELESAARGGGECRRARPHGRQRVGTGSRLDRGQGARGRHGGRFGTGGAGAGRHRTAEEPGCDGRGGSLGHRRGRDFPDPEGACRSPDRRRKEKAPGNLPGAFFLRPISPIPDPCPRSAAPAGEGRLWRRRTSPARQTCGRWATERALARTSDDRSWYRRCWADRPGG